MQRTDSWNRHVYPVQSPDTDKPPELPTLDEPSTIVLPKNISAVRDGQNHHAEGRTIVLCLDGTGDKFDSDNSNIVHLVSCLKKDDKNQATYYQAGIGTYTRGGLNYGFSAAMDMAVGSELGLHVRDAYHFLMHTYKEGDKICIFGFSRGAYTARCVAGMVHKVGLLPPRNIAQIAFAYDIYKDDSPEGWKQSADFKKTFCIDVHIYFLGAFDSVASVGVIPRQLPLSSTPWNKPRYFRHAMALDERRSKFKVCRHQVKDWEQIEKSAPTSPKIDIETAPNSSLNSDSKAGSLANGTANGSVESSPAVSRDQKLVEEATEALKTKYEREVGHIEPYNTDVLEVWFLGCHADVGGGAVKNEERHKLSHIPLRWMIRQSFECNTGILWNSKALAEIGLDVHMLYPKYRGLGVPVLGPPPSIMEKYESGLPPRTVRSSKLVPRDPEDKGEGFYDLKISGEEEDDTKGEWVPEQVEDFFDAMTPMNDQLSQAWTWWVLEFWPVEYKVQKSGTEEWEPKFGMNMGMYRAVEDTEPNLHWTVRQRMHEMNYKIRARFSDSAYWRIVA